MSATQYLTSVAAAIARVQEAALVAQWDALVVAAVELAMAKPAESAAGPAVTASAPPQSAVANFTSLKDVPRPRPALPVGAAAAVTASVAGAESKQGKLDKYAANRKKARAVAKSRHTVVAGKPPPKLRLQCVLDRVAADLNLEPGALRVGRAAEGMLRRTLVQRGRKNARGRTDHARAVKNRTRTDTRLTRDKRTAPVDGDYGQQSGLQPASNPIAKGTSSKKRKSGAASGNSVYSGLGKKEMWSKLDAALAECTTFVQGDKEKYAIINGHKIKCSYKIKGEEKLYASSHGKTELAATLEKVEGKVDTTQGAAAVQGTHAAQPN